MLFSISAKTMFCLQSENGECHVCLILEYRRLHDKIARLVSGGAEEAGMKGWREARRMSSQSKAQSRQNEVRFGAPRCLPHGYHRIYINVEVAGEVWNVTGLTGLGGADARHTKGGVSKSRLASAWRCRAWRLASTSSGGASPPSPALRASSPRRTRNAAFAAHEITRKGSGGFEGLGSSEGLEVSVGSDVVGRGERGGDEGLCERAVDVFASLPKDGSAADPPFGGVGFLRSYA